jgi:hypothetical protein
MLKAAALLCLLALTAPAASQSLAEAAQRERERRQKMMKEKGAAAVVTGDDLKANEGALANDPTAPPAVAATPPPRLTGRQAEAPAEIDRRALEEDWRRRMAAARERVARAQERYELWSAQHLAPNEYFVDENGEKIVASAESLRRLIAQAKAELDAATQELGRLEEQARRENVPHGWLR